MQSTEQSDLIILDEILCVMQLGIVSSDEIVKFLQSTKKEVVLTGSISEKDIATLVDFADYVSEIKKCKHPYDKGMLARVGIEY